MTANHHRDIWETVEKIGFMEQLSQALGHEVALAEDHIVTIAGARMPTPVQEFLFVETRRGLRFAEHVLELYGLCLLHDVNVDANQSFSMEGRLRTEVHGSITDGLVAKQGRLKQRLAALLAHVASLREEASEKPSMVQRTSAPPPVPPEARRPTARSMRAVVASALGSEGLAVPARLAPTVVASRPVAPPPLGVWPHAVEPSMSPAPAPEPWPYPRRPSTAAD